MTPRRFAPAGSALLLAGLCIAVDALTPPPQPQKSITVHADIPKPCRQPLRAGLYLSESCPSSYRPRFSACSVYKGESCTDFCYKNIVAHGLRAQSCKRERPSLVDLVLLGSACRWRCWQAKTKILIARHKLDGEAHALVQVWMGVNWSYASKMLLFRPTIKKSGMSRPSPRSRSSCWTCRWVGMGCPGHCERNYHARWIFQI